MLRYCKKSKMSMRVSVLFIGLFLVYPALLAAETERKQYNAQFTPVQNSCADKSLTLSRQTVLLEQEKDGKLTVEIQGVPPMEGKVRKGGKFHAKAKRAPTAVKGQEGKFRIAGSRSGDSDTVHFLLIAEFFQDGKPYCTQSWNGE